MQSEELEVRLAARNRNHVEQFFAGLTETSMFITTLSHRTLGHPPILVRITGITDFDGIHIPIYTFVRFIQGDTPPLGADERILSFRDGAAYIPNDYTEEMEMTV